MRRKMTLLAVGCLLFFLLYLPMYGFESVLQRTLMFVFNLFLIFSLARWLGEKNKACRLFLFVVP